MRVLQTTRAAQIPAHFRRGSAVHDKRSHADFVCWFPGCGFRPDVTTHTDAEKAREAGEAWFGLFGHA